MVARAVIISVFYMQVCLMAALSCNDNLTWHTFLVVWWSFPCSEYCRYATLNWCIRSIDWKSVCSTAIISLVHWTISLNYIRTEISLNSYIYLDRTKTQCNDNDHSDKNENPRPVFSLQDILKSRKKIEKMQWLIESVDKSFV